MHKGSLLKWALIISFLPAALMIQSAAAETAEEKILKLLQEERPYTVVPEALFSQLGWDLPDGGAHVKALAGAAPGSAFDPQKLEELPPDKMGYRARWHVVRYRYYGLEWDITGLALIPNRPLAGMPTMAIVHG